ncbi:MAG: hypothetical protein JW715_16470 [Sedimentisphaerales bacterium]|nr:hypothetical protein [Sedimentisphaerales bacterium]
MEYFSRREFIKMNMVGLFGSAIGNAELNFGSKKNTLTQDEVIARRKKYLEILQKLLPPTDSEYRGRINVHDKSWEDWLIRTGELPPDFESMPSIPHLPDPLVMLDDHRTPIVSVNQWRRQRELIKQQFEKWIFGKMPPPPENVRGVTTATRKEGDSKVEDIRLEFGPGHKATLGIELMIPPGKGPFPVFLTNHPRRRPWVNTAIRRGYMGCIYYAIDPFYGTNDDSDPWLEVYPDYDFSALGRWAWGAMRAVDYLVTLPFADENQIAISAHSKNSKLALLAAAFDERIGAVVPSRGNSGDQLPWRYNTEMYVSEPLEEITSHPHWFHPRLRFFFGREHKLPVDQNMLLALVAPRGLMMSHAYMEHQGNVLAFEQSYRSVRRVYEFLGKKEMLGMYQQPGEHPSSVEDVEQYFDFFDTVFNRKKFEIPHMWVHSYSFGQWQNLSGEQINPLQYPEREPGDFFKSAGGRDFGSTLVWQNRSVAIRDKIHWALGEEPPRLPLPDRRNTRSSYTNIHNGWQGQLIPRPFKIGGTIGGRSFAYGDDLLGDLYYPVEPSANRRRPARGSKFPVVIWLHPYSYAMGYSRYDYWGILVKKGFAVMAFDQIGFGVRNDHAKRFYERYPKWSLLGKMVADTRAAIDQLEHVNYIDTSRVYVIGNALGAKVGLFTAALDERIKAVTVSCGFTSLRLCSSTNDTEGLRHYSHLHGLIPRFGYFLDHEKRLPIDYDEILACIAPRRLHIIAPTLDRYYPIDHVRRAVDEARKVFSLLDSSSSLELETPFEFNRYGKMLYRQMDWLEKNFGPKNKSENRTTD